MSLFEAFILGLLQGLTEFIPVSSSGHLLIAHEIFGGSNSTLVFDVALHVGTLVALLVYFRLDLWTLIKNITNNNDSGRLGRLLIAATIPAGLAGLLFSGYIDDNLRTPFVVSITLATVGLLMLIADKVAIRNTTDKPVSSKNGLLIGLAQMTALIPGVSRSGATITAGMFLGLSRIEAARFSFLLAIPIVAGSAFGVFIKESDGLITGNWQLFIGMFTAFGFGLLAIKFLLAVIARVGLRPFALYRIVLALGVFIFLV